MKKSKFTESQIIQMLKAHESGRPVMDICREYGISDATFYKWRKQFGGMEIDQLKRLRELEEENRRLKHMYADLSLDHRILKEVLEKKF